MNDKIILRGDEAIDILQRIEKILISLHNIGSHYRDKSEMDYSLATCRFIDQCGVSEDLATIRAVISEKFDRSLGDDDMDDIERAMESVSFWECENDISEK
ncbi:hypothetical protein ACFODT_11425 [Vibrio zhugei]|uniref:Uncharacterized protein n=1 Tax=Vibrio zhugei TaxID=2479546 RepID=A0ABV7CB66_9VIBR|nr:hypothetical protein [Vibrio zhugei]